MPAVLVGLLQGLLVLQLAGLRSPTATAQVGESTQVRQDAVLSRKVGAGERVVLTVSTTSLADISIYEITGEREEEELFRAGGTPRTAKVFTSVVQVSYPLASLSGTEFLVRIQHRKPGIATVSYQPGTQDEAMSRLRRGQNLERNRGTAHVQQGFYSMPLYQLVPGTVVELEVEEGHGPVALFKVKDYLEVREERASLASRCRPDRCVDVASGRRRLELFVQDYDDLYLVATGPVRFRYRVVATPEVLNYISSCT